MKPIYLLGGPWKSRIFGLVLLALCLGIFFSVLMVTLKHFFFPGLSSNMMSAINGGLMGGLAVLSFKHAKWYWDWADRVMAKLFRSNGSKQEG